MGDRIQAVVVSTAGGLKLSRKLARGAATIATTRRRVPRRTSGRRQGRESGARADTTCASHASVPSVRSRRSTSSATPIRRARRPRLPVPHHRIQGGRQNFVVSRRALLEEEQQATAAEVRKSIVEGAVITGRVASVREFGAFVDLGGGMQGLLHVSEMAWARVADTAQVVKPGDEITVKVLRLETSRRSRSA